MKNISYIGLYFVGLCLLTSCDLMKVDPAEGLAMGNSRTKNGVMEFTIANSSEKSGDIVISVVQQDIEKCTYITSIQAHSKNVLTLSCKALGDGRYKKVLGWADYFPKDASIAIRVPSN